MAMKVTKTVKKARQATTTQKLNVNDIRYNIAQINTIRLQGGQTKVKGEQKGVTQWYVEIEKFSNRYQNKEVSIKMIASTMTTNQIHYLERAKNPQQVIRNYVGKGKPSLDEVIRQDNMVEFDSWMVNENLTSSFDYDIYFEKGNMANAIRETNLKKIIGIRPR